jgi:hypothetical protein
VVRELAEAAQKKAESTEVNLGRVARLEAEVMALRMVPAVVPIAFTAQPSKREYSDAVSAAPSTAVRPQQQKGASTPPRQLAQHVMPISAVAAASPLATAPPSAVPPPPSEWNSAIVPEFPGLFEDFREKQFTLLWRGSRDGFGRGDFHRRCDRHRNTLTVILDTDGNIFGGFTRVEWESRAWNMKLGCENNLGKADPSLKSFLFTLRNPHNVPARRFALKAEMKDKAISCESEPNWPD